MSLVCEHMYVHVDTWKELRTERKLLTSAWKGVFRACEYQSDDIKGRSAEWKELLVPKHTFLKKVKLQFDQAQELLGRLTSLINAWADDRIEREGAAELPGSSMMPMREPNKQLVEKLYQSVNEAIENTANDFFNQSDDYSDSDSDTDSGSSPAAGMPSVANSEGVQDPTLVKASNEQEAATNSSTPAPAVGGLLTASSNQAEDSQGESSPPGQEEQEPQKAALAAAVEAFESSGDVNLGTSTLYQASLSEPLEKMMDAEMQSLAAAFSKCSASNRSGSMHLSQLQASPLNDSLSTPPSPSPAAGAGAHQARQGIYAGDSDLQPRRLEEDLEEARRDISALQRSYQCLIESGDLSASNLALLSAAFPNMRMWAEGRLTALSVLQERLLHKQTEDSVELSLEMQQVRQSGVKVQRLLADHAALMTSSMTDLQASNLTNQEAIAGTKVQMLDCQQDLEENMGGLASNVIGVSSTLADLNKRVDTIDMEAKQQLALNRDGQDQLALKQTQRQEVLQTELSLMQNAIDISSARLGQQDKKLIWCDARLGEQDKQLNQLRSLCAQQQHLIAQSEERAMVLQSTMVALQDFIPACEARLLAAEEKHSFMSPSQEVPPVTPSMEKVEKVDAAMPAQHKTPTSKEYMIGEPGLRGKDNPRGDAPRLRHALDPQAASQFTREELDRASAMDGLMLASLQHHQFLLMTADGTGLERRAYTQADLDSDIASGLFTLDSADMMDARERLPSTTANSAAQRSYNADVQEARLKADVAKGMAAGSPARTMQESAQGGRSGSLFGSQRSSGTRSLPGLSTNVGCHDHTPTASEFATRQQSNPMHSPFNASQIPDHPSVSSAGGQSQRLDGSASALPRSSQHEQKGSPGDVEAAALAMIDQSMHDSRFADAEGEAEYDGSHASRDSGSLEGVSGHGDALLQALHPLPLDHLAHPWARTGMSQLALWTLKAAEAIELSRLDPGNAIKKERAIRKYQNKPKIATLTKAEALQRQQFFDIQALRDSHVLNKADYGSSIAALQTQRWKNISKKGCDARMPFCMGDDDKHCSPEQVLNLLKDDRVWQSLLSSTGKVENWHVRVQALLQKKSIEASGKFMKKFVDYCHNVLKIGGDRNKQYKGRKLFYQYVNKLQPAVDFGEHFGVGGEGWDPNFWAHRVDDLACMDAWDEESESEDDSDSDDEDGRDGKEEEEDEDKSPPRKSREQKAPGKGGGGGGDSSPSGSSSSHSSDSTSHSESISGGGKRSTRAARESRRAKQAAKAAAEAKEKNDELKAKLQAARRDKAHPLPKVDGSVAGALESYDVFQQKREIGAYEAVDVVDSLKAQNDDPQKKDVPHSYEKAPAAIIFVERAIKGERLLPTWTLGKLAVGTPEYYEEVIRRFGLKWRGSYPREDDAEQSDSRLLKLQRLYISFHFYWNLSFIAQKDYLESICNEMAALGDHRPYWKWQSLLRKRSYPRDRRAWPEKWNDRLKGPHPDGMITDQEFRAYYKSHSVNVDEAFTSEGNAPHSMVQGGIGADDGNYSDHEANNVLIKCPDHLRVRKNGFTSTYVRNESSRERVSQGLRPRRSSTRRSVATASAEEASADEAEMQSECDAFGDEVVQGRPNYVQLTEAEQAEATIRFNQPPGPAATGCAFHKVHNNPRVREQFKARFGSSVCGCYKRSNGENAFDISGLSASKNQVAWKRTVQLRQEGDIAGVRDHLRECQTKWCAEGTQPASTTPAADEAEVNPPLVHSAAWHKAKREKRRVTRAEKKAREDKEKVEAQVRKDFEAKLRKEKRSKKRKKAKKKKKKKKSGGISTASDTSSDGSAGEAFAEEAVASQDEEAIASDRAWALAAKAELEEGPLLKSPHERRRRLRAVARRGETGTVLYPLGRRAADKPSPAPATLPMPSADMMQEIASWGKGTCCLKWRPGSLLSSPVFCHAVARHVCMCSCPRVVADANTNVRFCDHCGGAEQIVNWC